MSFWRFILNRAIHHRQIFFTLIMGVVFATALLFSGPLIENTVLNLSIPYKLQRSDVLDGNVRLTTYEHFTFDEYYEFNSRIRGLVSQHLGDYISTIITGGISGYTYPWLNDAIVSDHRISMGYFQELDKNTHIISGEWPSQAFLGENEIGVVISEHFSDDYQLFVGDRLPLSYTTNENEPALYFRVSGIISPNDPKDIYWFGDFNPLLNWDNEKWSSSYIAFVDEDDFFTLDNEYFYTARSEFYWNVIFNPYKIKYEHISQINSQFELFRLDGAEVVPKISIATNIINILNTFNARSRIVRITIDIFLGEILFLAIFYIIMISTIFAEYHNAEFSNLSSRGSSSNGILIIQLLEALVICGIALVIGVVVAIGIVWLATEIGPIAELNQSNWSIRVTELSFFAASAGILLCIVSLLIPVRRALNRSIVIHSREIGRKARPPIWQRLYIDVILFGAGTILLIRFHVLGGVASAERGGAIDWLLLLTPIILLVSTAIILNRIFPIVVKGLCAWMARGKNFTTTLALYFISRNPNRVSRLLFLLILTMALGVLSAGMNATLDASEYESALYAIGSPFRYEITQKMLATSLQEIRIDDVSSSVYRSSGSLNIRAYHILPSFEFIAIEPFSFIKVTKFRSDYSSKPMGEILGSLVVDPKTYEYPVIELPGNPNTLGLWIFNDTLYIDDSDFLGLIALRAKIQSAKGDVFVINLTLQPSDNNYYTESDQLPNQENQWHYFEGIVPKLDQASYPLSLLSLWFNIRSTSNQYPQISLLIDDLSVTHENNDIIDFENFENIKYIWHVNEITANMVFTRQKSALSGTGCLILRMPPYRTSSWGVGVSISGRITQNPIPVIASEEFLNVTKLEIGDNFIGYINSILIPMIVAERVNYFPTMYDQRDQGFLVLPRDPLFTYLNQETIKPFNVNEIWSNINYTDNENIRDKDSGSIKMLTLEEERKFIKADPLSLSLRSIILISFWISVILSILGVNSYFYINTRSRQIQFGILRSIGMSIRQLYSMLFIEQVFIIFIGLSIGLLLGLFLNIIILPGLPITLSEKPPIPPFLPHMDWLSIFTLYAIMMVVFLVFLGITIFYLSKIEIHKVLRIGME